MAQWVRQLLAISLLICFCASAQANAYHDSNRPVDHRPFQVDPYEGYNRMMFKFNEGFDKVIFKPVAHLYNKVIPDPIDEGVTNFFKNLGEPVNVLNDMLQGHLVQALSDTWRFGVNSTAGLLGLFDVAHKIGLEHNKQDMGMTLARWGYHHSAYLVLPFFGPSTIRDTIGMPVDYFATPWPYIESVTVTTKLYALDMVDKRADLLKSDEFLNQVSVDDYIFMRDAYLQYRERLTHPEPDTPTAEELELLHMS